MKSIEILGTGIMCISIVQLLNNESDWFYVMFIFGILLMQWGSND